MTVRNSHAPSAMLIAAVLLYAITGSGCASNGDTGRTYEQRDSASTSSAQSQSPASEPTPRPEPEPAPPLAPFDSEAAEWSKATGTASLAGDLYARTRGGQVISGAGFDVWIAPDQPHYHQAWAVPEFRRISGRIAYLHPSGHRSPSSLGGAYLLPTEVALDEAASEYVRAVKCDGQGRWQIPELPAGTYVIHAVVTWVVGREPQTASILETVTIAEGESKTVSLHAR